MEPVTPDEIITAYKSYRELTNAPYNKNVARKFRQVFLGLEAKDWYEVLLNKKGPRDAVSKIKWLNGPNRVALYKVWKARNGE